MTELQSKTQRTIFNNSQEDDLGIAITAFLLDARAKNLAQGTQKFYSKKLALFLRFSESQVITSISQITPDVIRQYLFYLEQKHNEGGRHACYRTLRVFLNWYWAEYEPDGRNPITRVKPPKLSTEPIEPIRRADFDKLLAVCHGRNQARNKAILLILLDSGVRAAELLALDLQDIDTATGVLVVKSGKGRKPRITFFGKETRRAIRQWLKIRGNNPGALFITTTGTRLTYDGLRGVLERLASLAGVPAPSAHDFRRAFTLAGLQAGVSELSLSRMLGHTTTALIRVYAKQTAANLQELYKSPVDADKDRI